MTGESLGLNETRLRARSADGLAATSADEAAALLGPDTLQGSLSGNRILWYTANVGAGALQSANIEIGATLADNSYFFRNPYKRLVRSSDFIIRALCSPDPEAALEKTQQILDFHNDIRGIDTQGRDYYARSLPAQRWAQATFFMGAYDAAMNFTKMKFGQQEQELLYDQNKAWWVASGQREKHYPSDLDAFMEYWTAITEGSPKVPPRERLERTTAFRRTMFMLENGNAPRPDFIPIPIWVLIRKPVSELMRIATAGGLPEGTRELLEVPFSDKDERRYGLIRNMIKNTVDYVPDRLALHSGAREGLATLAA